MKKVFFFIATALCLYQASVGQVRIVALGSSTTMGASADPTDSSWVSRLQAFYQRNTSPGNPDTLVTRIGGYGYTTYHTLPTGYRPPFNRGVTIDVNNNITAALSQNPDIVIVNLPSNDVANLSYQNNPPYSISETMDNFRVIYREVISAGKRCFICTTQPRNDIDDTRRRWQLDLRDSINAAFGPFVINFWNPLVTSDGTNRLRDDLRHIGFPDADYHLNNAGHRLLFLQVAAKNIFAAPAPLPIKLNAFNARAMQGKVLLDWQTSDEEPNSFFEVQRSSNGQAFTTLQKIVAKAAQTNSYNWTDESPLAGKGFYRLRINENGRIFFSKVLSTAAATAVLQIKQLTLNGNQLNLQVEVARPQTSLISIVNMSGATLLTTSRQLLRSTNPVSLALDQLPAGQYFVRISANDATDTKAFQKMH